LAYKRTHGSVAGEGASRLPRVHGRQFLARPQYLYLCVASGGGHAAEAGIPIDICGEKDAVRRCPRERRGRRLEVRSDIPRRGGVDCSVRWSVDWNDRNDDDIATRDACIAHEAFEDGYVFAVR